MSVLVTGCAGFIGSNVCRVLLDQGESVVGVDDLNDAYDVRLKDWRLRQTRDHAGFRFHQADVSDYQALRSIFEAPGSDGFSAVLNLGARAGVRPSVHDPWVYYQANTTGTLNLLELCKDYGVKKFVLSSTSSVYGSDTPQPFHEDAMTGRPLSPYAASKKAAETLVYTYHHLHGIDATVLRYFTVYGPAGRPDMAVFIFSQAIAEGRPITVFGDGRQERDFTYVDDVALGTVAAMRPMGYEIINLGNDRPVMLADLIAMLEDRLDKKAHVKYADMHTADVRATRADISKASRLLGWSPRVPLEEGIQRTVDWYLANREWAKEIKAG